MLTLLGIAVVVVGFVARINPLLVVVAAALVTGLAGGMGPLEVVALFGKAFKENRYVSLLWLVLPAIGLLERYGLQERAKALIGGMKAATTGRILLLYLIIRQGTSALGLTSLGGHPQMVRPLVAPMAEAAAETHGHADDETRQKVRAMSAATDNIGLFFGEDIFIAIGSILLMVGFLQQNGIVVEPLHLSIWAIPTAIVALLVHGTRLVLFDRKLKSGVAR
ncbi:DUF969 domain-containing protein [Caulobacter sp. NIBR2454]|uniref:DUF969 domain-containing protein n=1 Tax=Caulobacter sp. NIBR2454 TaxID=3015996 RepID=UPI0022B61CFA|nr:DUF969 domain-containing protein [Caulobacter sp. NIBR2454]